LFEKDTSAEYHYEFFKSANFNIGHPRLSFSLGEKDEDLE